MEEKALSIQIQQTRLENEAKAIYEKVVGIEDDLAAFNTLIKKFQAKQEPTTKKDD